MATTYAQEVEGKIVWALQGIMQQRFSLHFYQRTD
jgi:hypothetical protein